MCCVFLQIVSINLSLPISFLSDASAPTRNMVAAMTSMGAASDMDREKWRKRAYLLRLKKTV